MKTHIAAFLFLVAFSTTGFSQNQKFEYTGRTNPTVKKEQLSKAKLITDVSPVLWHFISLPNKDRIELDKRRKEAYSFGFFAYPLGGYNVVINYSSVEISVSSKGKTLTAKSNSDLLTDEQKRIISLADLGSDIDVKITFNYKNQQKSPGQDQLIEGNLAITVVPEKEAEFPNGYAGITKYLMENIINKISTTGRTGKLSETIVKFTVNEHGQVENVKLFQPKSNEKTDKLVLDVISNMPNWIPAKNLKGENVAQEICIPFGGNNTGC